MSRIDEALKRASYGSTSGRGAGRSGESSLRLAEDFTLNEYPQENRNVKSLGDSTSVPIEPRLTPPAVEREVRTQAVTGPRGGSGRLVVAPGCGQVAIEQYRRLAATLHEVQAEKGLKVVMVTSALPKEGKTLTVVNVALTLTESYSRRVLLIDADLRRPTVHEVLGVANDVGLSEALRSERSEVPIQAVSRRLSVLTSGRPQQNPLAGLASPRMRALLDDAASRYDWILLDAPPVGLLPDAQLLRRLAQAVIFVIRSGVTPFPAIDRALAQIGRDCIVGTVLNGVEEGSIPSTGYYADYYRQ